MTKAKGILHGNTVELLEPLHAPEGSHVEVMLENAELERRFRNLANRWKKETAHYSIMEDKAVHPAYQEIIGMGQDAIPLILKELQRSPGHWFWALRSITGEDPIPSAAHGNIEKMKDAWLDWGRANEYVR